MFYEANKHTYHAEQMCIKKCKKSLLKRCKLIIVKLRKDDTLKLCEPCPMCNKLINKYKILSVEVYYQKIDNNE